MKKIILVLFVLISFTVFSQNKIYVNSQTISSDQTSQTINFTIEGLNQAQITNFKIAMNKIVGLKLTALNLIDGKSKTARGKAILTKAYNKNKVVELLIENHIKEIIANGVSSDVIDYFFKPKPRLAK